MCGNKSVCEREVFSISSSMSHPIASPRIKKKSEKQKTFFEIFWVFKTMSIICFEIGETKSVKRRKFSIVFFVYIFVTAKSHAYMQEILKWNCSIKTLFPFRYLLDFCLFVCYFWSLVMYNYIFDIIVFEYLWWSNRAHLMCRTS